MSYRTRRLVAGPLLVAALSAGLAVAPAAANAAVVTATVSVGSTLKVRSAPSLAATIVGSVRNKQKVSILCSVVGLTVRGKVRTTNLWDRLGTGRYISHGYVQTTRAIPRCATTPPKAVVPAAKPAAPAATFIAGAVRSSDGNVNLRGGPSTTALLRGAIPSGMELNLACAVAGTMVVGTVRASTQWDRLADGRYIAHAYVVASAVVPLCPGAIAKPSSGPVQTHDQFIAAAVPGAQRGWREYGVPASVTLAQAILESGWGRSGLSAVDKNYFGIKCQTGKYGDHATGCHLYTTQECTKAGLCFTTTATFRTYRAMADSFRDHGSFLRVNRRYQGAFAYTRYANQFIWTVWKAGYATDPNYYTKVTGVMAANNLYQYDVWK
jgi:uncharacterized protein YraI